MAASALAVEDIVKYFPVQQTGARTFLNPFSPLTHPALLGVSFQVGRLRRQISGRGVLLNSQRISRKMLAFFKRDVAIARSYRIAFALEILEAFFDVATFYYLSRFVSNAELTHALPVGSDYFAFALVGFALFDYLTVSFERL